MIADNGVGSLLYDERVAIEKISRVVRQQWGDVFPKAMQERNKISLKIA